MNYRVVLADDEPEVLRSIQRTLDWEKYGFSVVGAFLNGLDVLEFLENHDVDIVFTDIRMPFMDGIELMHKIKEKYPYIKLVIISGYDDFQYAKEALIHGVLDYILKPINAREMSEVLQKVKDKMDTELEEKQSIQKLRNLYLENQPIIRENFLNRLVLGNIKAKALQEEKKTGLIRMGEYKYWATALAQIYQIEQKDHGETMDSQLASIYIRNLIRNSISDDIYYEAFYNPLGECILFGMNEPEEMEKILLKLNDIAKESKRVMKIKAAIGVGKIKDELIKVKESFEEAKEALSYRKMSQDGDVIYMEDIDKSEQVILLFDEKAQDKLFTAVKFGKEEDIHAVIRKMKEYLIKADMSSSSYQAYSMSVINALLVFARQQDLEIEEVLKTIRVWFDVQDMAECLAEKIHQKRQEEEPVVYLTDEKEMSERMWTIFQETFQKQGIAIEKKKMTLPNLAKYRDRKQQAVFICSSPKITEEASDYLKSKNQVIYGIGYSDEVLQGIREGKVEGVMAYSMYSFGIYAVKSAIYSIEGKKVDHLTKTKCEWITQDNIKEKYDFLFPIY